MSELRRHELKDLVRSCVQCALCLPHCATWLATGNEVNSPRGRLLLLEAVLEEKGKTAPIDFLAAFDQCIGCRACEAMCPSGVPFSLFQYGQQMVLNGSEATKTGASLVPGALLRRLDSPGVLSSMRVVGEFGRTGLQLLGGKNWRKKFDGKPLALGTIARLLGTLPYSPDNDRHLVAMLDDLIGVPSDFFLPGNSSEYLGEDGKTVAFFHGCASEYLLPGTSGRMRAILNWLGYTIIEPKNQVCCGALADHTGRPGTAAAQSRAFHDSFSALADGGVPILVEAAGCSHHLQEDWQNRVTDAVVFLARMNFPPLGSVPLKVAYHDPCHALHGQGIKEEPRSLLNQIPGLQLCEPEESEVCCGSGGAWGLRYPELSAVLARRKARNLVASGARIVVTSNPGCLGQIADGLALEAPDIPILPLSDLLWYSMFRGRCGKLST